MARRRRITPGGYVYHVCNRGSRKGVILESYADYVAFCTLLEQARLKYRMRIVAYNLLTTHFHFLLWPWGEKDLPRFMKWLTGTHARQFHLARGTVGSGAVYQSRYVSRMIVDDRKFYTALKYVEGNARRHKAVERAEYWQWSSLWTDADSTSAVTIVESPLPRPTNWLDFVNDWP